MLETLNISNYALIDETEIGFHPGLNIITGETGAGKSIILGALSMLLGSKTDSKKNSLTGKKTIVEAEFDISDFPALTSFFDENDLENPSDRKCIVRRETSPSGRTRSFINDSPVALTKLQDLTERLTDIHSQNHNQLLAKPEFQLEVIDTLASNSETLADYEQKYSAFRESLRKLKKTRLRIERARNDEDFLRYQLGQFDKIDLKPDEFEDLESELKTLSGAAELKNSLRIALDSLSEGHENALGLIEKAKEAFDEAAESLDGDEDISDRLEKVAIELNDIVSRLNEIDSDLSADPAYLERIEDRLSAIRTLMKKHSVVTYSELLDAELAIREKIESIENADITLSTLEKDAKRKYAAAKEAATILTARRKEAAISFEDELLKKAIPLGMKNLRCKVKIEPAEISPTGMDKVTFTFAFNKNQELSEVGGKASGGEISRLMLCVKSIVAGKMKLPTVIFDEIDTGVSGEVAAKIGEMMRDISKTIQVIAITHLPQVAAMGDHHFKVFKTDDETSTHTNITELDKNGRIEELAMMLGGGNDKDAAIANAQSLLNKKETTCNG
ncbi:MAG: DNA repair protein RecN [Paramuribaculum sp.]|nr:DNA repair protein RecN [Paramuribaculum sp.]